MKVAHIVAPQHVWNFGWRPVQMALAPWLREYYEYRKFYAEQEYEYVILDNGLFELNQLGRQALLDLALEIRADVVVLPDTIGNSRDTLDKSLAMAEFLVEREYERAMMFVPQGLPNVEWKWCLREFLRAVPHDANLVLGLAEVRKHQVPQSDWKMLYPRGTMLSYLLETGFPVHLLGIPNVDDFIRYELPCAQGIASVDTSLAYALGMSGQMLTPESKKVDIFPVDKWDSLHLIANRHLVERNMATLDQWAKDGDI